ncbi:winged helix-turn-helix domain-containing protein [Candidatus Nitrososphaera sp. FF02]|uniref:winged helix-turn-helix domain-containing protein n=1 Tax=Candidatus Nitrososphaera sp. FF02 TaxID=3398226 RepID=UPI0039EB5678
MPSNRTHIGIIADILDTASQYGSERGAPVTHLIRRANVPHRRLSSIVSDLKASGLLHEVPDSKYLTTEKGREFLKNYTQFRDFAEGFGLKI